MKNEYLATAIRRMKYYKELAEKTFDQLPDEELHYRPNEESNSIAVIIRHMAGNMRSRWTHFLSEDGEKTWRDRDREFDENKQSRSALEDEWNAGWRIFLDTLESLQESDLHKIVRIRGEELTVIDAINRQLAHYPYHVGQIVYIGKVVKGKDWKNLSIPKGHSASYNRQAEPKDPARKY